MCVCQCFYVCVNFDDQKRTIQHTRSAWCSHPNLSQWPHLCKALFKGVRVMACYFSLITTNRSSRFTNSSGGRMGCDQNWLRIKKDEIWFNRLRINPPPPPHRLRHSMLTLQRKAGWENLFVGFRRWAVCRLPQPARSILTHPKCTYASRQTSFRCEGNIMICDCSDGRQCLEMGSTVWEEHKQLKKKKKKGRATHL